MYSSAAMQYYKISVSNFTEINVNSVIFQKSGLFSFFFRASKTYLDLRLVRQKWLELS